VPKESISIAGAVEASSRKGTAESGDVAATAGTGVAESARQQVAAIDLGSNSFHMVVAWREQGGLQIQESLSEKVQLGAGLDAENKLTDDAQAKAFECLGRFAERTSGIPRGMVRVVGTNTLRVARNARAFLRSAEEILGHDIEIVAGREEARLIYLGVSHHLADSDQRRLVVDIGGGSTEIIIGERFESVETESLHMGCVSYTGRFFGNGMVTEKSFDKAVTSARPEVLSIDANYRRIGWQDAIGASGTVKAIAQVCEENGWSESGISLDALQKLRKRIIKEGAIDGLVLKGLRADRASIFPAGVTILLAIFEQLELEQMSVASGALREGLLYDLIGRFSHEDVRERSIEALMTRHHVEADQAIRVSDSAQFFYHQVAADWQIDEDECLDILRWGALLHEVGLSVSHSQFHKHGAYLALNSDLPGFSKQEQLMVAMMIRGHRRKIPLSAFEEIPAEVRDQQLRLCMLLRVAARLHHARTDKTLPQITAAAKGTMLKLTFPDEWLAGHPLTMADFEQEQEYFNSAGYTLVIQ
jgi:exopolyphosphatase/guanosine-5'-triphosphate,3'-diphosphate pyrophosphatase